ncbi:hypothetical protein CPB86DRAFT_780646, partial [Serendipita vermifera]
MTSIKDIPQTEITHITGQCRCGAVSYQFPLPPTIDVESPDAPQLLKDNLVPPSKQKFPERGVRPNSNRWRASYCHCAACRQTVGALVVNWVNIPTKDIQISRNGPTGKYRASNHATREFCQTCGMSLFFLDDDDTDIMDVTVASINVPNVFDYVEIYGHIWLEDVSSLVLDEAGKGGGIAGLIDDGLSRARRERGSAA